MMRPGSTLFRRRVWAAVGVFMILRFSAGAVGAEAGGTATAAAGPASATVEFTRDIAPILFARCAGCHRPGESAPFNLLTYEDARKHAEDMADVTHRRFMPPWLPSDGLVPFLGERRLSDDEIRKIQEWVRSGTPRGDEKDMPKPPTWTEGWQLGQPDLVVSMPAAYELPGDGKDVYRNFVMPVPTTAKRYVRAYEFRPSSKAVHHAFIRIDGSGESRKLDAGDSAPGFAGMEVPPSAESPSGHFLGWQPGRLPVPMPDGLAWTLPAGADVVLLMHMQPRGKPESIRPSIGFYFTDIPPTNTPTKLGLRSYNIDIPPGATDYAVEETVRLPVDTDLLAVLPHAHYLGKRLEGFAILPDGQRKTLMLIPDWDFNWQSDYRFAEPVFLPRGTTLGMRFTFDNSTNNVRNPRNPPVRVKWGLETQDEMGELWFQMLAHDRSENAALEEVAQAQNLKAVADLSRSRLARNAKDAESAAELAKVQLVQGRVDEAEALLRQALAARPDLADAHYHLGIIWFNRSRFPAAEQEFLETVRLEPGHFQARNNLGLCYMRQGKLKEAAMQFQEILRIRPGDKIARGNLELVRRAARSRGQ